MSTPRVSNLTLNELKKLIRSEVRQTLREMLADPDEGLELSDEFKIELQRSLDEVESGGKTQSAKKVAVKLGLNW
jgi:hypothetical protein